MSLNIDGTYHMRLQKIYNKKFQQKEFWVKDMVLIEK